MTHYENIDLERMTHPETWPLNPCLPVKKRSKTPGAFPECGVVIARIPTVFLASIQALAEMPDPDDVERIKYPGFAEMVADGWMVD